MAVCVLHVCVHYRPALLALRLWDDAGAVGHQQIHHRVPAHEHRGSRHHVAEGDHAAGHRLTGGGGGGGGGVGVTHRGVVGTHVALQLCGGLAVHAAQLTDQDPSGARGAEASAAVLPLLTVVLLSVDPQVRQRGETAVAQMAGVML